MPGKMTSLVPKDWQQLESVVAEILTECGLKAESQATLPLPRGSVTVDVLAEENVDNILFRIICECKNWRTNIPQDVVHGFRTVLQEAGAHRGYIISKVGFQAGAIEAAKSTNIDLVTFDEFQNLYFEKWIEKRLWAIEERVGDINTYYEPFGIPGISQVDDESHELAYVEVWKKHLFVGFILPLFSPYSRAVSKQPPVAIPLDVTKLEEQGINLKGPEAEHHILYASHTARENRAVFEAWTKSEAFRAAHSRAGDNKPMYLDHPQFEGFEVRQTVGRGRAAGSVREL